MPDLTAAERELLVSSPWLSSLAEPERRAIVARSRLRAAAPGETLFHQGAEVEGLHVLVGGRVKLSRLGPEGDEVIMRMVAPGDLFAALAALDRDPPPRYPVAATALAPSRVAFWPRPEVRRVLARHPELSNALLGEMADRARELQDRLREVATERVPQRMAHVLLRLAERRGRETDRGVAIDFPLTREDLARMAGTTLYTASRLLSGWAAEGVVGAGRRQVVVRSPRRLEEIARG